MKLIKGVGFKAEDFADVKPLTIEAVAKKANALLKKKAKANSTKVYGQLVFRDDGGAALSFDWSLGKTQKDQNCVGYMVAVEEINY